MPLLGKPRSSKRSSSSSSTSYVSTISMVVFIALCVLGLWMLTSSSVGNQQNIQTRNAFSSSSSSSSKSRSTHQRKDPPAFHDTQGDLPDDAIQNESDELKMSSRDEELMKSSSSQKTKQQQQNEEEEKEEVRSSTGVDEKLDQKEASSATSIDEEQQQQLPKQTKEAEEEPNLNLQDTEMEIRVNPDQNTHTEIETRDFEQHTLQDPEVVTHESSSTTQQETGEEENPKSSTEEDQQHTQSQQESESTTATTRTEETHEQNSEPEIREVTSSDESQQTQLPEEDHQQSNPEVTSDENQQQTTTTTTNNEEEQPSQQTTTTEENTETENQETQKQSENQETAEEKQSENTNTGESFPGGAQSTIPKESSESKQAWSTQADQSVNQKERRKDGSSINGDGNTYGYTWQMCNVTAGQDYIPCLDNEKAVKMLHYTGHFEHRERHCPQEGPTCLVPMPTGYKQPIEWPKSRDKIWYHNVPHPMLAEVKGHQNWVKVTGEFLQFPGGGTQFIHGALHYIDFIQKSVPNIAWGKRTRVILDVGCGVASFGGYLFERDVLAMSFAPKDEHEAQVQFALERGIPAISAVMGSQRLPFPSRVFDLVHCARCRVPWHAEGGRLLLELNRVLRPGGYFVWSATPVYQKLQEDVEIWEAMSALTISMCWELFTIKKDKLNSIGAAVYRKPTTNDCYEQRKHNKPPMCKGDDDPNAAWYVPLQACIHRVPVDEQERGSQWPKEWPNRVHTPPYWLNSSQKGIYGKSAPDDFASDYEHWKRVVTKSYMTGLGISWANVRNVMDMRAVYGGFAAALKDLKVWVMNVVNVDAPDTLPIIYERGLFGIYHDWCESFSTYPRTYDLLHADQLFSRLKKRCNILPVIAEVDRIVRPGGKLIVRDESSVVGEIENILKSLHWEIHLTFSKDQEAILSAQKTEWRPETYAASS